MGEGGRVDVAALHPASLEGDAHPLVQPDPPGNSQVVVESRPHQGVGERIGGHADAPQEMGTHRLVHQFEEVVATEARHHLDDVQAELVTHHRRHVERGPAVRGQLVQAMGQHAANRRRHGRQLAGPERGPLRVEESRQLQGEERIAPGVMVQCTGVDLIRDRLDERGDLADIQPVEVDMAGGALEQPDGVAGGGARRHADVPGACQHQGGDVPQLRGEIGQQPDGRHVGPVQVVDDKHEGRSRRHSPHPIDHVVEVPQAGDVRVLGRTPWVGGRQGVVGELAEQLLPEPERRLRARLPASRPRHPYAASRRPVDQLLTQPRLADTRLAGDENQPAATGDCRLEPIPQLTQLSVAADERWHPLSLSRRPCVASGRDRTSGRLPASTRREVGRRAHRPLREALHGSTLDEPGVVEVSVTAPRHQNDRHRPGDGGGHRQRATPPGGDPGYRHAGRAYCVEGDDVSALEGVSDPLLLSKDGAGCEGAIVGHWGGDDRVDDHPCRDGQCGPATSGPEWDDDQRC